MIENIRLAAAFYGKIKSVIPTVTMQYHVGMGAEKSIVTRAAINAGIT